MAIKPINYEIDQSQPIPFLEGMKEGLQLQEIRQKREAELARQEQEKQKILAEERRQQLYQRLLSPDVAPEDYKAALLVSDEAKAKSIMQMMEQSDKAASRAAIVALSPVVSALHAGNPDRAISILEQRGKAYEGRPDVQEDIQNRINLIKASPESAKFEFGGELSVIPGGSDVLGNILKLTEEKRAEAEAKRTKLSPAIQEAIDFKNLSKDDQQAFLSLQTLKRPPPAVTNVSVTNLDKSAATELGQLVPKLYDQANSAASQLEQLPRYRRALDSAITGTFAESRLTAARIGNALGFTDDKAAAASTELIQGLAEMGLQSRGMITGQGAISNEEQKLLIRARSGDINLTKAELNVIFNVAERSAKAQYAKSRKLLESAASKSETAGLFLQNVSPIPEDKPEQPQGMPRGRPGVTVTLPNGQSFVFPNQQAADQFKARAGVR